jgi:hypothetical protein
MPALLPHERRSSHAFRHHSRRHPVTLSDGEVAVLARQVVDRRDPELEIEIVPADPVDPYRLGQPAWTVSAGGATSYLTADMTAEEALARLTADLGRT